MRGAFQRIEQFCHRKKHPLRQLARNSGCAVPSKDFLAHENKEVRE